MGTTDHLTLLRLFFLHCFTRRRAKIRKFFFECKLNNDQIPSIKSSFTPKIGIFRLYSNNITVRDTFAYKHTLIACVIVHGSLSIIKTSTAGMGGYIRCNYFIITHWLWCHLMTFYCRKQPYLAFRNNTGPRNRQTNTDGWTDRYDIL